MKVAVVGSRSISEIDLSHMLPPETTEIVSGGAKGVDAAAAAYAASNGIKLTVFMPEYQLYGRAAPLKRNEKVVSHSDLVLAFWDGSSSGTKHVIRLCEKTQTPFRVIKV